MKNKPILQTTYTDWGTLQKLLSCAFLEITNMIEGFTKAAALCAIRHAFYKLLKCMWKFLCVFWKLFIYLRNRSKVVVLCAFRSPFSAYLKMNHLKKALPLHKVSLGQRQRLVKIKSIKLENYSQNSIVKGAVLFVASNFTRYGRGQFYWFSHIKVEVCMTTQNRDMFGKHLKNRKYFKCLVKK